MPWAAIGVPIDSVGLTGGTELAPGALRAHRLIDRLGAQDCGDLRVGIRDPRRDEATGVIGLHGVLEATEAVRAAVRDALAADLRPLVLGGDCTLLPGALAGARDAGQPVGLAYVDGHVDVYDGETSPSGEAADMPLGVALGLGPPAWVQAAGGAVIQPEDVVILGARDRDEAKDIVDLRAGPLRALEVLTPETLRQEGLSEAGARAVDKLAADGTRFWLHLDVDVLDELAMRATDYLMPGGLDWDELDELLGPLGASPALAGASLGCLNPEKDPDGSFTEATAAALERALGR